MKINYKHYSLEVQIYIDLLNKCDEDSLIYLAKKDSEFSLEFIKDASEKVQLAAVSNNGSEICWIKKPSERVQLEAIKNDPYIFRFLNKPTELVKMEIVKKNGLNLLFISNPSRMIQIESINNIKDHYRFFEDCFDKITDPVALSHLFKKTKDSYYKKLIKESKFWKDEANLIIEVMNK